MDIKAEIQKVISSITSDPSKLEAFTKDPIAAVKALLGDAVPDDVVDGVVSGVQAELNKEDGGLLSGIKDKISGLFKK